MKMQITLSNFPMSRLEEFQQQVSKFAKVIIQVGGEDTVFLTCDADMVACQKVVIISDLYWGGDKNEVPNKTMQSG